MQIYHSWEDPSIVHEVEDGTVAAPMAMAGGGHRRLVTAPAETGGAASKKKNDSSFETAAISIFFDVSEFQKLTEEQKTKVNKFFDSIDHNGVN